MRTLAIIVLLGSFPAVAAAESWIYLGQDMTCKAPQVYVVPQPGLKLRAKPSPEAEVQGRILAGKKAEIVAVEENHGYCWGKVK